MADAIDNLAQDLNQANPSVDAMYPLGYENYYIPRPDDFGVPQELNQTGDQWIWDARNPQWGYYKYAQNLSNPSTLGTGTEIDFNTPDDPTIRTNIGNTDEKDAFVRTGIGTTLDPKTEDFYGVKGLVPPHQAGGFVGVDYLTPKQIEDLTAGQTPSSHPEEFITRGETIKIPGRGLPDYRQIVDTDGNISYINNETGRVDFTVPGVKGYPGVPDLSENPNLKLPFISTKTTDTSVGSTPFTPSPVGAYQPVGADEPTTTSVGGFDNTGVNVSVGPDIRGAGPGGSVNVTPGYVPKPEVKPGDEFKDSPWEVFDPTGKGKDDSDYRDPKTGELFGTDQEGYKWNYRTQQFDCVGGRCSEKPPVKDTPKPPVVITPPTGGGQPPGGGTPGGGPPGGGTPGRGPTPLPTREPVTPLVRREVVIPTKGTKEVPLPDRQADPFAKLYADLLANSQQQEDRYRYINYDPDQIMNAAMSGFKRRGAMRSLQG